MTLDLLKLKVVIFLLKYNIKINKRLSFYRAKYSAGKEVGNMARKQNFDMRKMGERMKNVMIHDQDVIDKRWDICKGCEFLTDNNRCEKCGCFMKIKSRIATVACPIGKWDKEYDFIKGKPTNGAHVPAK